MVGFLGVISALLYILGFLVLFLEVVASGAGRPLSPWFAISINYLAVVFNFWAVTAYRNGQMRDLIAATLGTKVKAAKENMVQCATCRVGVAKNAAACPHCGEPSFLPTEPETKD